MLVRKKVPHFLILPKNTAAVRSTIQVPGLILLGQLGPLIPPIDLETITAGDP